MQGWDDPEYGYVRRRKCIVCGELFFTRETLWRDPIRTPLR